MEPKPKKEMKPARMVEYKGETVKLVSLAKEHGINRRTLTKRIERGMSVEEALAKPVITTNVRKAAKVEALSKRQAILDTLVDTFFEDKKAFVDWIKDEKESDMKGFFKNFIMPFLPKEVAHGSSENKAIIKLEFNSPLPAMPTIIDASGKAIDA